MGLNSYRLDRGAWGNTRFLLFPNRSKGVTSCPKIWAFSQLVVTSIILFVTRSLSSSEAMWVCQSRNSLEYLMKGVKRAKSVRDIPLKRFFIVPLLGAVAIGSVTGPRPQKTSKKGKISLISKPFNRAKSTEICSLYNQKG